MSRFMSGLQKVLKSDHGQGSSHQGGAPAQPPSTSSSSQPAQPPSVGQGGKVSVGYFPNWGIYDRGFKPQHIQVSSLTHLLYCFADTRPESGEVFLNDAWADEQIHYDGDSWDEDQSRTLFGNLKAIYALKKVNRHLKVLLSIGGWTFSSHFAPVATDPAKRRNFVNSAVTIVKDYGLDGLDIDWEYPTNEREARAYVDLLRDLRGGLDTLGRDLQAERPFQLTIAAPAGLEQAQKLHVAEMDRHLSYWNLMTYDMAGSWDKVAGHQAPLFSANRGAPSVDSAVQFYLRAGVAPQKLVMGLPLYGRSFEHTDGPGKSFRGVGKGSWEEGTWDYKSLPLQGANETFEQGIGAAGCYDHHKKKFVSYDNIDSAMAKKRVSGEKRGQDQTRSTADIGRVLSLPVHRRARSGGRNVLGAH